MDLLLADDLTGCCDTGIKFIQAGLTASVAINAKIIPDMADAADMLAVNMDTRALSTEEAISATREICGSIKKKQQVKPRIFYKKLDSALRGNPGAEIAAIADFWRYKHVFVAVASPGLGRTVCNGVLEIDGTPLARTVFANDPGSPMLHSEISAILGKFLPDFVLVECQDNAARLEARVNSLMAKGARYLIFDSKTQEDLDAIAKIAMNMESTPLLAGSAGFAQAVCGVLPGKALEKNLAPVDTMLFVCGSANRSTHEQVASFHEAGHPVLYANAEMPDAMFAEMVLEIGELLRKGPVCIATPEKRLPMDAAAAQLAMLSSLALQTLEIPELPQLALYMTGGETAYSILRETAGAMSLDKELFAGVIAGTLSDGPHSGLPVVSKAGGFGDRDIMLKIFQLFTAESA